jgi:hypothetical protein
MHQFYIAINRLISSVGTNLIYIKKSPKDSQRKRWNRDDSRDTSPSSTLDMAPLPTSSAFPQKKTDQPFQNPMGFAVQAGYDYRDLGPKKGTIYGKYFFHSSQRFKK